MARLGVILIFFCAICGSLGRKNFTGLVTVDELRKEFLQLEEKLWDFVLDYVDNGISPKERLPEVDLIDKFERFGNEIVEVNDQGLIVKVVERRALHQL